MADADDVAGVGVYLLITGAFRVGKPGVKRESQKTSLIKIVLIIAPEYAKGRNQSIRDIQKRCVLQLSVINNINLSNLINHKQTVCSISRRFHFQWRGQARSKCLQFDVDWPLRNGFGNRICHVVV